MRVEETPLPGVRVVTVPGYPDERGFFVETFHAEKFRAAGLPDRFVQDNHSRSRGGVLRGLHTQLVDPQGKLVRVARGAIFDVAVDIRVGSPNFGRWFGIELSDDNRRALWVPPDFAHGFCALSETADVVYKCTALYQPGADLSIAWNDPEIGIVWPIAHPTLSEKDRVAPTLAALRARLPRYPG